jgi:hypothetical protein
MSAISTTCGPAAARHLMPCCFSATGLYGEAKLRTWARHDTEAARRLEVASAQPKWLRLARSHALPIMKYTAIQTAATAPGIDALVTNRVPSR